MKNSLIDISSELLLQPWGNGIMLTKPNATMTYPNEFNKLCSVDEISKSKLYLYMLDNNSVIQYMNEASVLRCGYPSLKKSLGKTRELVAKKQTVQRLTKEDQLVIKNNRMEIFEEEFNLLNEVILPSITFKFPWYGVNNKIIGLFGCSIILDSNNFSCIIEVFNFLMKLKLLTTSRDGFRAFGLLPGKQIDNIYLSRRESDVVHLIVTGKTIKEIAKKLALSPRTVEHYIENIKLKLNVHTKSELIDKIINFE